MRHLPPLLAGLLLFSTAMSSHLLGQSELSPVYIEDSPDADDLVKQAQVLRDQKRLTETAAMYQKLADEYPRKLMKLEDAVYIDGIRWVRKTVAADAELLAAYRALHEPLAARAVEEAGRPAPNLAAMERVAQQYSLCESGLEASLRAAALHLERGRPIDAANLLDDVATHADLAKQKARWHRLHSAAAVYERDDARLIVHVKALRDLKDFDALREIDSLRTQLQPSTSQPALSSLNLLPKVTVPTPLGKPLYVRESQADADSPRGPSTDPSRRPERAVDHHMIPTVAADTIYLNTGLTIRAMDRSSLSDIWASSFASNVTDGTAYDRIGVMVREPVPRDQRGVLVEGEFVAAVMGRVNATGRGQVLTSTPETMLVCVDRADGKPRWRRTTDQIDPSLVQSFFHGTPVGDNGRAYVMVRRSQNSGFRDAFLIAVDLHSGALVWKRHLSSTTPGYNMRGFTHLIADRGRLYVSDNLGAVACIDGRSGTVLWFHRMSQFKSIVVRGGGATNAAWTVSPPILVKAGLVVAPFMVGTTGTLFDPATGKKLRDLEEHEFAAPSYIMKVGDDILSVGSMIGLVNGTTLELKWIYDIAGAGLPAARGVVAGDQVMIPLSDRIITLSLTDGKKISETPVEATGNLLALDGQMLITTGTTVRSYMTWPVVYANLTSRIRRDPTDARPGLALAHAAIASNRSAEAIEGIDHVVAVMRHRSATRSIDERPEADEVHAELFQQLLRLGDAGVTTDVKLRGEVFDRIAKATVTPRDEAQYHLNVAAFILESDWPADVQLNRRRDAARHFQTVLESPLLSAQLVPRMGGWQQGGVEARLKLLKLIERHGRAVYEEFDQRAAEELALLVAGGDPDPAALVELTRKYPLSKAAGGAMLAAGEALAKAQRPIDAITQLRRAYREPSAAPLRAKIISRLAEQYTLLGKPLRARQWLMRAERDNLQLIRDGKPVTPRLWLADLGSQPSGATALPMLRPALGKPVTIPGGLLLPKSQPREQWPLDRALLQVGDLVQLRGGPAFDRIWDARIPPGAELLWLSDTIAIFWNEQSQSITTLDVRSGKLLWPQLKASALFNELAAGAVEDDGKPRIRDRGPDDVAVDPRQGRIVLRGGVMVDVGNNAPLLFPPQPAARNSGLAKLTIHGKPVQSDPWFAERRVRVIINDAIICVADSSGRVIGVDPESGQVKWRMICPFDRLDEIAISGECIAFAGGIMAHANTEQEKSTILALDALTGDVITQFDATGNIAWLGLSEGDALIYIHQPIDRREKSQVAVHQLPNGELQWRADLTTGRMDAVAMAGDSIAMLVDGSDLIVIDPLSRTVRDPLSTVMLDHIEGLDIAVAGDRWHLMTPHQAASHRSDAKILWRDGIAEDAGSRVLQLLGRENMLVLTFDADGTEPLARIPLGRQLPDPKLADGDGVTYRLFLLDRQTGSIGHEYRLPLSAARIDAQQSLLLNHRVLLGVGDRTIVIPDAD